MDDARPDHWGERVIRFLDKPARLSVLDYLFFAGDERFGALGVSLSGSQYVPRAIGALPRIEDVREIAPLVRKILAGEPVDERKRRLIVPGVTLGGARPKALLDLDGAQWVLKFNEPGEDLDTPLIEHAAMTLALRAGIRCAQTRPIPLQNGHAVAVKRFDREPGVRRHALSEHPLFGLATRDEAVAQVRRVCDAVNGWRAHFQQAGASARDIETLTDQIDRPFLLEQRRDMTRLSSR